MKYFKLTILSTIIGLGIFFVNNVYAATEFVSIIDPDNGAGTDYTSLSAWEGAVQSDLSTTTATLVFSYTTASGTIPDLATVQGETSGATATSTHMASSSNQILLTNISGTFQSGETIYIQGQATSSNYIISDDNGDSVIAVAKCRSTGGSADTTAVEIDGWTTSADNYIKVWTDPDDAYGRHNGKWNEGKYRLENSGFNVEIITNSEDYTEIDGLQINHSGGGSGAKGFFSIINSGVILKNTIIKKTGTTGVGDGISLAGTATKSSGAINCIIYNGWNVGVNIAGNGSNKYGFGYNLTSYGNTYGFRTFYVQVFKNCIANNNTTDFSRSSSYDIFLDNCISSDGTADDFTGANNKASTTVQFLDETNNDFHLFPTDTSAKNAGTSLFFDSNLAITDDIDGTSRGGAWDIGADEVPVEYISTICENTSAGGDCANMDYSSLGGTGNWEDKVESDLTASTTRVFSGTITGTLNENTTVNLCDGSTDLNIDGVVVATTSDQILIDNIIGTTTPLVASSSWLWSAEACGSAVNYWTISGTGDDLGASPIAIAMIDGEWSVADTESLYVYGWTTDNDNYIKIYTTDLARHDGKWDENKYRIIRTTDGVVINNLENYFSIEGLQISSTASIPGHGVSFSLNTEGEFSVAHCLINNCSYGIYARSDSGIFVTKIWNNISYDNERNFMFQGNGLTAYCYNNTAVNGSNRGFGQYEADVIVKNNLANGNITDYVGTYNTYSNNISEDDTSPDVAYRNVIVDFVSTSTDDFHLAQTDVGAQSQGTDLSSDANLNFTTDIDSGTRIGTWDIGADQLSEKIYRSVGNDSSDLNTDSRTVTISGTTAVFSDTMPDNIGVGDIIQYGGAGYYQIAIISNRSSSTEYTVQSYNISSSLSATTTASTSIYRAHLTLDDWEDQILSDVNTGISDEIDDYVLVGQDLTASNTIMMTACYASDNGDTEAVVIDGWTTGVDNYIKVYTPVNLWEVGITQRHGGKWDDDKYRLSASVAWVSILNLKEEYIRIDGLQIENTRAKNDGPMVLQISTFNTITSDIQISNSITKSSGTGTWTTANVGIYVNTSCTAKIWNNIIYDSYYGIHSLYLTWNLYLYNNTIYNSYGGVHVQGVNANTHIAKNNLINGSSDKDWSYTTDGGWDESLNNISEDTTSPDGASYQNLAVTFIDESNDDFHLSPTDTSAIDAGVNLSTSTDLSFSDDIDGHYRRQWDIGADEASVYFDSTIMESGGEFSSLSAWETANQVDLTATTTAVFSIASSTGWIPVVSSVTGATSGATASTTVTATSSNKILLYNISGTFISGEDIQLDGAVSNAVELSNAGNPSIAVAKIDGAWSTADETAVTIDGWTTGANNYIKVYTTDTARHGGKWDEGKYRISLNSQVVFSILESYVKIYGIQFETLYDLAFNSNVISNNDYGNDYIEIAYSIIRNSSNNASTRTGIYLRSNNAINLKTFNNIVYDFNSCGIQLYTNSAGNYAYAYNNTVVNCASGINLSRWHSAVAKNNITQNCTDGFTVSDAGFSDYNISDLAGDAPGSNSKNSTTVTFLDETNNDFHLSIDDTSAKNAGTDLSSDSNLSFTDDIDGDTRYDIAWDIGADETTTILYRSVGNDTNDLNINTATTTISTTTAEFSIDMPAKIGVGDVLQYGFPLQLGFITARTSSTTYEIQNRIGALPTATTSASVSIFRAHEFLDDWEDQLVADVNDGVDASVDDLVLINNMDLTASNTAMFVPCYASTSADNLATVAILGWTTATSSYIKIYTPTETSEVGTSQRHNGIRDNESYRLEIDATQIFQFFAEDIKIEGLQMIGSSTDQGFYIHNSGYQFNIDISHNIIARSHTAGGGYGIFMGLHQNGSIANIYNNLIYNWGTDTTERIGIIVDGNWIVEAYNNTISDVYRGFWTNSGVITAKNNAVFNCVDDFYGSMTLDYNASDDLDGTNAIDISPCPVEADCWKGMFMDYENYDFRIKNANSVLYNSGTAISDVTDDILGIARPQHGIYDVGAFEYSNSTPKYKFNGGKFKLKGKFEFK